MCGSTGVYVPLLYLPADEDHPWREKTPVNFYHQSQRDDVALALWEKESFPVTIFRPTNIIGAGRIGTLHAKHLVTRIPRSKVVAISDIRKEAAERCAVSLGIREVYADPKSVIDHPDNEPRRSLIVTVCTAPVDVSEVPVIPTGVMSTKPLVCVRVSALPSMTTWPTWL